MITGFFINESIKLREDEITLPWASARG